MSYIPARKMPHITAQSGEFDAETGKIIHLHEQGEQSILPRVPSIGWVAGAAGASLAAAVAIGAFFTLRSSSAKTPTRRRTRATAKPATATRRRRTTTAKAKKAA